MVNPELEERLSQVRSELEAARRARHELIQGAEASRRARALDEALQELAERSAETSARLARLDRELAELVERRQAVEADLAATQARRKKLRRRPRRRREDAR